MSIDYRQIMKMIGLQRKTIEQASLEDDALNAEFLALGEIEEKIRMILKARKKAEEKMNEVPVA